MSQPTPPIPSLPLNTRIPVQLRQAMEERAKQEGGISLTQVLIRALVAYLDRPVASTSATLTARPDAREFSSLNNAARVASDGYQKELPNPGP